MKTTLPYPPTGNLYWRHARGRTFLSAAAKAFKAEVSKRLADAKVKPQEGPLALHVHVYRPRKVGDLDNTLKVLGDALNGAAWHDDRQVVEIHAYRHDDKENPRAEVEVLRVVESTPPDWDILLPTGQRMRNRPRTGAKAGRPDYVEAYTPPRSTPVDAAKEAEVFAPPPKEPWMCRRAECTLRGVSDGFCSDHRD